METDRKYGIYREEFEKKAKRQEIRKQKLPGNRKSDRKQESKPSEKRKEHSNYSKTERKEKIKQFKNRKKRQ